MKKYVIIYHANVDAMQQLAMASPEEAAKGMEGWMQWAEKCGKHLLDLGAPLGFGQKLSPDGSSTDSTREVVGYSILEANNMDEAKALLTGHPHNSGWSQLCSIEIHETMPLPGM